MIKVYLDWSVMTLLKNGKNEELKEILSNKERFLIPYSTAHIGDLFSSFDGSEKQQEYIDEDLKYISELTDDLCLFTRGENILIDEYTPKELFEQRIDSGQLMSKLSENGISALFDDLGDSGELGKLYTGIMKSLPIGPLLQNTLSDPEKVEQTEKLFPGITKNPTMEGMINSVINMMQGLNENESYKDLRKTVQTGLNIERDKIYDSKDPFGIIDNEYEKAGVDRPDQLKKSKHGPAWYNEICSEYIQLDMHGYHEDKVNTQKGRKETFKNTTEDAFHFAFAATCNFYITNDNRSYNKAKKVYEKLGLNTIVLKPNEFIKYFNDYWNINNDAAIFYIINEIIKQYQFYEEDMKDSKLRIYLTPYFLFDFFNKIMVIVTNDDTIKSVILSRNNPTHNFTLNMEVEKLINRLMTSFGPDTENAGTLNDNELKNEEWTGRTWSRDSNELSLKRLNGHFQFYLHFKDDEAAQ